MTTTDTADAHAIEHLTPRQRIFAIVGASSGNLVEWFDFYIYSFCPKGNPTTQLLNTAGIFAAGFLMRPIGGWLFGRVADRVGRRTPMIWFGALAAVFTTPIMMALRSTSNPLAAGALIVCALACLVAIRMPDPTRSGLLK